MLKIIKYDNANALEATWLREITPEVTTPEVLDADGNVVEPSKITPATYEQVASIAYADVQMDLLRADVAKYGGNITPFESLIAEVQANRQPLVPQPVTIPSVVTMRQARVALLRMGLLSIVTNTINSGTEEDKITWEFSTEIARDFPLVQNMKVPLGLSEQDLDNLFILASTL